MKFFKLRKNRPPNDTPPNVEVKHDEITVDEKQLAEMTAKNLVPRVWSKVSEVPEPTAKPAELKNVNTTHKIANEAPEPQKTVSDTKEAK